MDKGIIAKLAVPERILIVKELPLTTVGKIDKKVLRERYQRLEAALTHRGNLRAPSETTEVSRGGIGQQSFETWWKAGARGFSSRRSTGRATLGRRWGTSSSTGGCHAIADRRSGRNPRGTSTSHQRLSVLRHPSCRLPRARHPSCRSDTRMICLQQGDHQQPPFIDKRRT